MTAPVRSYTSKEHVALTHVPATGSLSELTRRSRVVKKTRNPSLELPRKATRYGPFPLTWPAEFRRT